MTFNQDVYLLTSNVKQQSEDSEVTFKLVSPVPAPLDNRRLWHLSESARNIMDLPVFYSYFEPFDKIDYPDNDQALHILSKKALSIVKENFPDNRIKFAKILVIDTLLQGNNDPRADLEADSDIISESVKNEKYYSDEFYMVDFPILDGLFDLSRSKYKIRDSGEVGWIDEYALTYNQPLPPIFFLRENLGSPLITGELRALWRRAGIYGTTYLRLDAPYNSHETDVDSISQDKTTSLN